jgi:hypothetical protein
MLGPNALWISTHITIDLKTEYDVVVIQATCFRGFNHFRLSNWRYAILSHTPNVFRLNEYEMLDFWIIGIELRILLAIQAVLKISIVDCLYRILLPPKHKPVIYVKPMSCFVFR